MPTAIAEQPQECYGDEIVPGPWRVNCGYYGLAEDSTATAWVVEVMTPPGETSARELASLGETITALVEKHLDTKPKAVNDALNAHPGLTGLQALFCIQMAGPKNRVRLRAEHLPEGWLISEYDFRAWSEIIPTGK